MTKSANPDWKLNADWGVGRDPFNWILYQRSGKRWRPKGYYPNPALLLQSLHSKILRTEPLQPDLLQHLETCLGVAQGCAERLAEHIHTHLGSALKMTPQTAHTILALDNG